MPEFYCPGCEQQKTAKDFALRNKLKGTYQRWCRVCLAAANRKHYQKNKELYIQRARTRSQQIIEGNQKKIYAYLSAHPCVDCGIDDARILEFDHICGTKIGNITSMLHRLVSWSMIEEEIAKCEVRCVNCHRIKTSKNGGWWRSFLENESESNVHDGEKETSL